MLDFSPELTNFVYRLAFAMNNTNWSVNNFLKHLNAALRQWGQAIVAIVGVVMVIVSVFHIAKGLMSGGRAQTNWVLNLLLFFVGGALAFSGGWGILKDLSGGATATLNDLAGEGQGVNFIGYSLYSYLNYFKPLGL